MFLPEYKGIFFSGSSRSFVRFRGVEKHRFFTNKKRSLKINPPPKKEKDTELYRCAPSLPRWQTATLPLSVPKPSKKGAGEVFVIRKMVGKGAPWKKRGGPEWISQPQIYTLYSEYLLGFLLGISPVKGILAGCFAIDYWDVLLGISENPKNFRYLKMEGWNGTLLCSVILGVWFCRNFPEMEPN